MPSSYVLRFAERQKSFIRTTQAGISDSKKANWEEERHAVPITTPPSDKSRALRSVLTPSKS